MKIRFMAGLVVLAGMAGQAAGFTGAYNVLDYGAVGDGTNDNTVAVQKGVEACVAGGGGQVILPGDTENILFANMTIETRLQPGKWWGAGEPIHVSNLQRHPAANLGHVRHIRFSNILCRGENGIYLRGCSAQPLEDLVFDNVRVNVRVEVGKTTDVPGGFYDDRPIGDATGGQFAGVYTNIIAGIHADFVNGLTLENSRVVWGRLEDYYGPALACEHVNGLQLDHFNGNSAGK
jgi:hypothetical protein